VHVLPKNPFKVVMNHSSVDKTAKALLLTDDCDFFRKNTNQWPEARSEECSTPITCRKEKLLTHTKAKPFLS
jgi:hypothetical protein